MGVFTDVKQESSLSFTGAWLNEACPALAHARDYKASTKAGVIDLRDTCKAQFLKAIPAESAPVLESELRWYLAVWP